MSDALPERPELAPSGLEGADFGRSRKGFEPTEVRSLLGRGADALRVWAARDEQLVRRVEELSRRLDEAEHFDEDRVTELLGSETARIVAAARDVANDLRSKAEKESTELLESSRAEAEATSSRLVAEATEDREVAAGARAAAEAEAAAILAAARAEADGELARAREEAEQVRTAATDEAEELRANAREEADRVRAEAAAESERRIAEGQQRQEVMVASAAAVLDERTAEAEEAAAKILAEAREAATTARTEAEGELAAARTDAERLRADALVDADRERDAARDEGRRMVAEAREVRQRMLRDLAERSRAGRQKVEAARAARIGIMEAIREAAGRLDATLGDLDDSDHRIRRAAEAAAAAVPDDVETVVRELEEELAGHDAAAPTVDTEVAEEQEDAEGPGDAAVSEEAEQAEEAADAEVAGLVEDAAGAEAPEDAVGAEAAATEAADAEDSEDAATEAADTGAAESEAAEGPGSMPSDEAALDEAAPDEAAADEAAPDDAAADEAAADEPAPAAGETDEDGVEGRMASVHDLFERLRSDDDAAATEVAGEGGAVAVATVTEVAVVEPEAVDETGAETGADTATGAAGDEGLLDRRDDLLAPALRLLGRNLKRFLSDEQNDVLDRARRIRRQRADLEDLLDDAAAATVVAAVAEPYRLAAVAGAQLWSELSGSELVEPAPEDLQERLAHQVDEMLELRRAHIREALDSHAESGADASELVDQLRAAYRELRATSAPELAADLATGGFARGTEVAAGADGRWRWIPDNGGLPCADAEDNALAGALACGAEFPTGDVVPPAHPGCRCIVVPVGD